MNALINSVGNLPKPVQALGALVAGRAGGSGGLAGQAGQAGWRVRRAGS